MSASETENTSEATLPENENALASAALETIQDTMDQPRM